MHAPEYGRVRYNYNMSNGDLPLFELTLCFMVSAMFTLEIGDDKRKVFDTSMKQNFEIHAIDVGKIKKIK